MPPIPGSRFGVYEITGPLGAGGMGEVYRAKDSTLGREVALKFIPESFASEPERLMRFEREARTLATLNHPNIAQIYGVETSGATRGIVMELVEGSTLAEMISAGKRLALDEAISIALQITSALEAAHDAGIIHRDLKPANIKVRSDGTVKVLDFGIAKAIDQGSENGDPGSANQANSPTITTPAMTMRGIILGTAAYMSPEQARGRFVDKRADIWSFGCVLYEMLTGRRAFDGEDATETLAAVVRAEPEWSALSHDVPPAVKSVLQNCLIKDPGKRLAAISTASFLLRSSLDLTGGKAQAAVAAPRNWGREIAMIATAAIVFGAIGAAGAWRWKTLPSLPVTRFSMPLPEDQPFTNTGRRLVAVSPDGTLVAYAANRQLYLRKLAELSATPISGTDLGGNGVALPVFSPDGLSLAFIAAGMVKRISVAGGVAVTICAGDPWDMSWDADSILFAQPEGVFRVAAAGGKPELIVPVKNGELISSPQLLQGGRAVLMSLTTGTSADRWDRGLIAVHSLSTGERRTLVEGGNNARYLRSGHIAYSSSGVVLAVPFDVNRLEVLGAPTPVIEGVSRGVVFASAAHFAVSETGTLVYVPGPTTVSAGDQDLALMDQNGAARPLGLPRSTYVTPRVSPNGRSLAVGVEIGATADLWIHDFEGGAALRRLTFGGHNRFPVWAPDGQRIAFQSDRDGDVAIFVQKPDGSGPAERLTKPDSGTSHWPYSWSPGGQLLFGIEDGNRRALWTFSTSDRKAVPFGKVESSNAVFSPDGHWVAYVSGNGPANSLFVQPFPPTGATYLVSRPETQGNNPFWSPDGTKLFYARGPRDYVVSKVTTQPAFSAGVPLAVPNGPRVAQGARREYDIMPDGTRLLIVTTAGLPTSARSIHVVLNWFEELKARAPRTR